MNKRRKFVVLAVLAACVTAALVGQSAIATHTPADKAVAAGSKVEVFSANGTDKIGAELLRVTLKTSKPTDLMMHVAAECEVFTQYTRDGKTSVNEAAGSARLWLEFDGKIVPINTVSEPPQDPAAQPTGGESDKVTFCEREEAFEKSDNNVLCVGEQPAPLPAPPVNNCEFEDWFQRTKSANAFNWVRLNAGSGEHTIVLRGDVRANGTASPGDVTDVRAAVGNRTLIVEPTKMSNDTLILPAGTS
ncbi:MAG TPA: hypothetical protein VG318_13665 [Actinomycetota bacterium]|nr:hypothetical protein [Actinomycetota bacterium]